VFVLLVGKDEEGKSGGGGGEKCPARCRASNHHTSIGELIMDVEFSKDAKPRAGWPLQHGQWHCYAKDEWGWVLLVVRSRGIPWWCCDCTTIGAYDRRGVHHTGKDVATREELIAMAKSLLATGRGKQFVKGKKPAMADKAFADAHPVLHAYLTEEVDEEGKSRSVSKATVFVEQGQVKVSLSDPDNDCSLYVSCDAFASIWEALEGRLASGEADWRSWKGGKAKAGKRRS
jgi:hypothetical protein